ncbi:MAG TPA: hypothetical protein VMX16_03185 [Terriglobia bacterium]|nr:hypothetical protein [Terriglobia bacterium]
MADQKRGLIAAGFSLVWRRQRVLWWVYIVNLILGIFATLPVVAGLGRVMNHSLYSARLYHGFDLMVLTELLRQRGISTGAYGMGSMVMAMLFFILMLVLSGGILTVYVEDQTPSTEDFFRACGRCFWRFFRLVILLLIVMVPVDFLGRGFRALSNYVSRVSPYGERAFLVAATGWLIVLLILMAIRLWFDLAEVHIAAGNERASRRALGYAWRMMRGNFWYLYGVYFRISLLAYVGLGVAFWIWVKAVRPESVGASFLLGQAVIFIWLFTRLWQRASESIWYNAHRAAAVEPVPVTPAPEPALSVAAPLTGPEPV